MKSFVALALKASAGFVCLYFAVSSAWSAPNVVVSIAPIHSLVSAVMEGVGEPVLLFSSSQSPHTQPLKPSAVRHLLNADLVIWIDPSYEITMKKLVENLDNTIVIKSLLTIDGISTYSARASGAWATHDAHDLSSIENGPDTTYIDPHIWLSTVNAKHLVNSIKQWLTQLDPNNAARYAENTALIIEKINRLKDRLHEQLSMVESVPYIVFHDAYQYFETEFGLNVIGSVTLGADKSPGVKRLRKLIEAINTHNVQCVFSEPQFQPKLLKTITEQKGTRVGQLDPLGSRFKQGPDLWSELMESLAKAIVGCLTAKET